MNVIENYIEELKRDHVFKSFFKENFFDFKGFLNEYSKYIDDFLNSKFEKDIIRKIFFTSINISYIIKDGVEIFYSERFIENLGNSLPYIDEKFVFKYVKEEDFLTEPLLKDVPRNPAFINLEELDIDLRERSKEDYFENDKIDIRNEFVKKNNVSLKKNIHNKDKTRRKFSSSKDEDEIEKQIRELCFNSKSRYEKSKYEKAAKFNKRNIKNYKTQKKGKRK